MKPDHSASVLDYLKVFPQYFLPQRLLSRITYSLTRCEWPPLKNLLIKLFITCFRVDMSLARQPDATAYQHFNDFFTRELKPGIRSIPQDKTTIICPVDGSISQIGKISGGEIFQAKGRSFDLESLVADQEMAGAFRDGQFATFYLSPRDYHRIHMPLDGKLIKMIYVPGRLFAVNTHTTRVINNLFARNERVICLFATAIGPMAMIMVGAINVGSMETIWAGEITPAKNRMIATTNYQDKNICLNRGDEMGRFNMGSTVIVLIGKKTVTWFPGLQPDKAITMGNNLGLYAV